MTGERTHPNGDWEQYIIWFAEKYLNQHDLTEKDWTVKFIDEDPDSDDGSAGYCWQRGRVIFFTREYLLNTDERNIEEAILHEVAHAIVGGDHTRAFYDKLKEIGGTGNWYGPDGSITTYPVKY